MQRGPSQKVPEAFVNHSAFYYIRGHLVTVSAKKRRTIYNYWARVFGLSIVELKRQLKAAQ